MGAGVLVVLPDQLAEQQRGAAVGPARLDLLVKARVALLREDPHQQREREDEHERVLALLAGERAEQADRAEQHVQRPRRDELAHVDFRRTSGAEVLARARDREVERQLRGEREQPPVPVGPVRAVDARARQHERGAERPPAVGEARDDAIERQLAPEEVRQPAEQAAGRDERGRDLRRQHEQHRDEGQLRRDRVPGAGLELEARQQRERDRQDDRGADGHVARAADLDERDR